MSRRGQWPGSGGSGGCSGCDPTQRRLLCVESQAIYVEVFVQGICTIWWGDTQRDTGRESISHTYKEVSTHRICVEPYDQLTEIRIVNGFLVGTMPDFSDFGEITHINLNTNQLSGTIPPEIGNLSELQILRIRHNQLSGTIPPEIGNLSELQALDLRNNLISGTIPIEIGNLSELQALDLLYNQISGNIPNEIGNLSNLQTLDLRNNQISGTIPIEIGNLSNLWRLNLRNNQISGTIPPEIGNLSELQTLDLRNNLISGTIPPEIGNLSNLTNFALSNCQLSGAIPAGIAAIALEGISLQNNNVSQADMSEFVDALYANRATLGSNSCLIDISNNNGLTATAINQIEGTGSYSGDGLVQAGCFVTY